MSAKPGVPQASHRAARHRGNLDWQAHAACRDYDPEMFHDPGRAVEALSVCRGCPVRSPCADLGAGCSGVWGGQVRYPRKNGRQV